MTVVGAQWLLNHHEWQGILVAVRYGGELRVLIVRAYSQRRMEQWFADLVSATI